MNNRKKIITLFLTVCIILPLITSCQGDVITETETGKEDKVLEDHLELVGAIGSLITGEYGGYLGYGYNVVTSGYFNASDVSTRALIFDTDKLIEKKRMYKQSVSYTDTALYMGETLESYQKDVASNLGISFSYGIFSKVKGDFSLSANMSTSGMSKSVFIKNQIKIKKERQFINYSDLEMDELKEFVNKKFLRELNADISSKSSEEKQKYFNDVIFSKYGTHVLMDIMLGGRMDLNYVYKNSSQESLQDIKGALDATYETFSAKVSGSVSVEKSTKAQKFAENSTFTASRVGGSVAPDINTYEKALDSYKEWAQSIQDGKDLDFFDVGSNCQDSLLPIWEFANTEEKRTEIILAYEKYVSNAGKFFADLDKSIGKEVMPLYIKNIYLGSSFTEAIAKSDIDKQIAIQEPDYLKKVIVPYDLNKGAGGEYIFIGYTLTDNPDEAITDIKTHSYPSFKLDDFKKTQYGYTYIEKDLNSGLKRTGSSLDAAYVLLYYTKDKTKGQPIKEIGIEVNGVYSFGSASSGWAPALSFLSENRQVNCNAGILTAPQIYVWCKR